MGGLFSDGEEATAPEDISKWTVDDVCSFVGGLSGCGEYTRVRGHLPKMVLLSCSPVPLLTPVLLLKGCMLPAQPAVLCPPLRRTSKFSFT